MDIKNLTKEERIQLKAQIKMEEREEQEKALAAKEAYIAMRDEFVETSMVRLTGVSDLLVSMKRQIFEEAQVLIEMKNELFKTKNDRLSDTFTTQDGQMTIKLGRRTLEGWDDTVENGVAKVKEYINTLARDENSSALVETILRLLSKDKKGTLKASKILEIEKLAMKLNDPTFNEGIRIIKEAYRPSASCTFIEVDMKDENGKPVKLPLSMGSVE